MTMSDVQLTAQVRQGMTDGHPPRLADDVADDQAPHGGGAIGHRA